MVCRTRYNREHDDETHLGISDPTPISLVGRAAYFPAKSMIAGTSDCSVLTEVGIIGGCSKFRTDVAKALMEAEGFACVCVFASLEEALPRLHARAGQVLLVAGDQSGVDCSRLIQTCRKTWPDTLLLAITTDTDVISMVCAGADGYILETSCPEEVLQQIRNVVVGGATMTPVIARRLLRLFRRNPPLTESGCSLTPIEFRTLRFLAHGRNRYEASSVTKKTSTATLSVHTRSVYRKVHMHYCDRTIAEASIREHRL
jgi:DNA-binding NarL/FixJ family response regulator